MRYAQSRAIARSKPIFLEFDLNNQAYWLSEENEDGQNQRISGRLGKKYQISDDLVLEVENEKPYFF